MTAKEFGEWQALYLVEPWGEYTTYLSAGVVASTVANVNRKPDTPPFSASDFIPQFGAGLRDEETGESDPDEFIRNLNGGS
jgi:hypothetical protein